MIHRLVLLAAVSAAPGFDLSAQPTAPRVRVVEDLRLDANAEDFSTVSRFYVGPRGEIVVPLMQDMQLRIYDSTGKRIASVGRRGSGPGEFQSMTAAGWIADTLWVHDGAQQRTTHFSPDGKVLRTVLLPATLTRQLSASTGRGDALLSFSLLSLFSDGSMLGASRRESRAGGARQEWGERVLVNVTTAGAPRVLGTLPDQHDERWFMTISGFGRDIPFAFQPQVVVSADGRGVAFLTSEITSRDGGTFAVTVLRSSTDTIFARSYPFRGTPIPRRVADSAIAALAPPPGRPTEGPAELPSRFQALARQRMPPVYTPLQAIRLGLDNTVWITLRDAPEGRVTLVLNDRGDPVGTVLLTPKSRIWQASASHVWVTESDADGLTSVVRYRVSGLQCGPPGCGQ